MPLSDAAVYFSRAVAAVAPPVLRRRPFASLNAPPRERFGAGDFIALTNIHGELWRGASTARNNFDQDGFRIGAPTKRQHDTAQAARDDKQRGAKSIDPLVETVAALPYDRRAAGKAYLTTVGMARQGQRNAARLGLVEVIGIVRKQKMRRAVGGEDAVPIWLTHDPIIDAAEYKTPAAMS